MDKFNIIEPKDSIPELEYEMNQWLQLPTDFKFRSNDDCIRLHGCTVPEYYTFIKIGLIKAEDTARSEINPSNLVKEEFQWSNKQILDGVAKMDQLMQNPYIILIKPGTSEPELSEVYTNYLNLNAKNRRLSDYYSVEIWGINVRNMFELNKSKNETFDDLVNKRIDDSSNLKIEENAESIADAIYNAWNKTVCEGTDIEPIQQVINEFTSNDAITHKLARKVLNERNFNTFDNDALYLPRYCPWFTLQELNEMNIDGTIPAEIKSNMEYRKAVIEAYNTYQSEPTKTNELNVLKLGWNPHIEPTTEAFKYAKHRQIDFINEFYDNINEDFKILSLQESKNYTFNELNYPIMFPVNELDTDTRLVKEVCLYFHNKNK